MNRIIKKNGSIFEIGSGSGQHGLAFQKLFPKIICQTIDPELLLRKSISSWIAFEELNKKMPQLIFLDVEKFLWKIPLKIAHSLQSIISINMVHIAQWSCSKALFRESEN